MLKIFMMQKRKKRKMNGIKQRNNDFNVDDDDRLSKLPDSIILHILSFLDDTKQAVQTSTLSKAWNNSHLWKFLPILKLTSNTFRTAKGFNNFASRFFSLRDSSTALHVLSFHIFSKLEPDLLNIFIPYAVSHHLQHLTISASFRSFQHIPRLIFSSPTLMSLTLTCNNSYEESVVFPNTINLPALTRLKLDRFVFSHDGSGRAEPFSAFKSLNDLILSDCSVDPNENKTLCISSTTLVNLTIHNKFDDYFVPCHKFKIELFAPSLCSFAFLGTPFYLLGGSSLSSIKQLDIDPRCWERYRYANAPKILLSWLIQLADIELLAVSSRTLHVLSLALDLSKVEHPSLLCNLKLLKVRINRFWQIPDGIVDCLLQNAPHAEVSITHRLIKDTEAR